MRTLAAFALLLCLCAPARAAEPSPIVLGVVPQQSAEEIHRRWSALAAHLSGVIGREVRIATAPDIPRFEACLAAGAYDLAYMNPYHYVVFHDLVGYRAIARRSWPPLRGILVVRADSDIRTREDLAGARVAFPSLGAFGASVIQRAELRALGVRIEPHYVKSHASVYLTVSRGYFAAGGGVMRTFNAMDEDIRASLRVIYTSDDYTPHAIAAHPRLSPDLSARLADAMADATNVAETSLRAIGMEAIIRAADHDWDDVRRLGVQPGDAGLVTEPAPPETCVYAGN